MSEKPTTPGAIPIALEGRGDAVPYSDKSIRAALVLTETRPCPLCGSEDDSRVYAEEAIDTAKLNGFAFASRKLPEYMHHRLVLCPTCDLVYASPIPRQGTLGKAYEEADFDSGVESRYAARTSAGYVKRFLDKLPPHLPNNGEISSGRRGLPCVDGILDIGAGDGAFLGEMLDLGFTNVEGVEPSTAPIEAAPERVRRLIRQGLFNAAAGCASSSGDSADYEPESFSLITCFQVIEHVPDPLELVRGVCSLLKPGGAFLMISHNRNALSAKILGTRSPIFDIEHLQLFSMPTAKRLFRDAGLVDIRGFGVVNRYPLHYYLKLMPIPNRIKTPLLGRARRSALGQMAPPAALGNLGVIGFKR